jgi:hypothetical protein
MTKIHLRYVQSYRGYHYFRRRNSPYVQLPGIPGSAGFMAAYQSALAAAPVAIGANTRGKPGSVSAAIAKRKRGTRWRGGSFPQRTWALEPWF